MKQGTTWKSQHENDGLSKYGNSLECPRDLVGYGNQGPTTVKWPNNAKVAINFVLNYEEGGESCVLHGDTHSEHLLSEIVGQQPYGNVTTTCCCILIILDIYLSTFVRIIQNLIS